jgi:hypothetical protein
MNRRRLSVESWRDALLSATGLLDDRIGGPSIDPDQPDERRRTIYSRASRLELNKMLSLFDYPDANVHSERRVETTTPLQKLFVMNSPLMIATADRFAARVLAEMPNDPARQIERAYLVLFGRAPSEAERQLGVEFIGTFGGDTESAAKGWSQYAQVLLAANDLLFVD